jgi:hypothetical protein
MERPTPKQIKEARARLRGHAENHDAIERLAGAPRSYSLLKEDFDDIRILLAATEPPTDADAEDRWENVSQEAYHAAMIGCRNPIDFAKAGFFLGLRSVLGTPEPK